MTVRTENESERAADEDRGRLNPLFLHFWRLPLAALLWFLFAYIAGYGLHLKELPLYIKDIAFAIATALLVTWGLTILMEIPHVSDFVVRKLADLIFGEDYLKRIRSSLPELRKRIDRVYYGEAAVGYPWSLYHFIDREVEELFTSSFRRNYVIEITVRRESNGQVVWREETKYVFVRNKADKRPPRVDMYYECDLDASVPVGTPREAQQAVFNSRVRSLQLRVAGRTFRSRPEDKTTLIASDGRADELLADWRILGFELSYSIHYPIPEEAFVRDEALVEIVEEYLVDPVRDDIYYVYMNRPTEDFVLICNFPENVRLELVRFSMGGANQSATPERPMWGHGAMTINGWLLPGHGACVGWFGLASEKAAREKSIATQAEASAKP